MYTNIKMLFGMLLSSTRFMHDCPALLHSLCIYAGSMLTKYKQPDQTGETAHQQIRLHLVHRPLTQKSQNPVSPCPAEGCGQAALPKKSPRTALGAHLGHGATLQGLNFAVATSANIHGRTVRGRQHHEVGSKHLVPRTMFSDNI